MKDFFELLLCYTIGYGSSAGTVYWMDSTWFEGMLSSTTTEQPSLAFAIVSIGGCYLTTVTAGEGGIDVGSSSSNSGSSSWKVREGADGKTHIDEVGGNQSYVVNHRAGGTYVEPAGSTSKVNYRRIEKQAEEIYRKFSKEQEESIKPDYIIVESKEMYETIKKLAETNDKESLMKKFTAIQESITEQNENKPSVRKRK